MAKIVYYDVDLSKSYPTINKNDVRVRFRDYRLGKGGKLLEKVAYKTESPNYPNAIAWYGVKK